jgi:hypothetical protein
MTDERRWIISQFEPRASASWMPLWIRALCSIAISLRRIADKDNTEVKMEVTLPEGLHHEVTNMAWEAGRNFKHGTEIGR